MDGVAERIKAERRLKGWSQKDLAEESGVNQDTISGVESGRHEPRPSTLRKLAAALGVEVADFFKEPAFPKAEPSPPSEPLVGEGSEQERLDLMDGYRESVLAVVEKLAKEFQEAREARDTEALLTLYSNAAWARLGAAESLEDEEAMQEREGASEEEGRARHRVWRALFRFDDLAEDIEAEVDAALEEKPASVVHLADLRRRRAG